MFANTGVRQALCLSVLFAYGVSVAFGGDFDGWSQGRATFYGNDGGASINSGSCMFGQLDANKGTGLDIAALSDKNPDYAGSCGRCYEVACRPANIGDGYGHSLDRSGYCQGQKSVTVMVTDTCPCYYPNNAYSNTRWCCGDEYHMDLSVYAFQKIASTGAGAIGIYYRVVDCPGTSSAASSSSSSSDGSSSSWSSSSSSNNGNSNGSSSGSSSSSSSGDSSSWSTSSSSSGGSSSSSTSSSSGDNSWHSEMMSKTSQYSGDSAWPNRGHRKTLTLQQ